MKLLGFMHIYAVNNYQEIVSSQCQKMIGSGLLQEAERIYYTIVGEGKSEISLPSAFERVDTNCDLCLGEMPILMYLLEMSKCQTFKAFYIHTKGVSKPACNKAMDWRCMMEYFVIEQFRVCLAQLEKADVAGVNWHFGAGHRGSRSPASPHFSGNFWWANSEYIKRLPELTEETSLYKGWDVRLPTRWDAEFWIGRARPKVAELWNSNVHHGSRPYPAVSYKGKRIKVRYYG